MNLKEWNQMSEEEREQARDLIRERQRKERDKQREATRRMMELAAELHLTMSQLEEAVKSVRSSMVLALPADWDGAARGETPENGTRPNAMPLGDLLAERFRHPGAEVSGNPSQTPSHGTGGAD